MKSKVMQMSVVVAVMMLAMGAGSAMAVVTADSATWEYYYEADAKPELAADLNGQAGTEDGWHDIGGGGTNNTVIVPDGSNNYLQFDYDHDDGAGSYEGFRYLGRTDGGHYPPGDPDSNLWSTQDNGGLSMEMRLRVHSGYFFMHVYPSSATNGRHLSVYVTSENVTLRDHDVVGNDDAGNTNGPGEWTTIRITTDDTNWNYYRDTDQSVQASTPVVYARGSEYGLYQMAVYGTQANAVFDLDYIRWTNEGALVIPEPATMALLGLGGLAMLRRRRNR